MNSIVKKSIPHLLAIISLLILSVAYFYPQLQGKVLFQSDITQYQGMSQEIKEFKQQTGETTLWTNSMFGGMPTYQINTVSAGNNLKYVDIVGRLGADRPIGRFFMAMLCFYIMMVILGANPLLSAVGAFAFAFTTNHLTMYEAGHVTKLRAISYFPLIAAGMILAFRGKYLLGGLIFALGAGLNIWANHIQMTYFFVISALIYGIAQFIHSLRAGELPQFGKAIGVLTLAGLLALGSAASNLWVTYEYSKETMRGKPILEIPDDGHVKTSSETDGLDWEYAMAWSNNTLDLFSSFIPGVVGGGTQEPVSRNSAVARHLEQNGYRVPQDLKVPLYWGAVPFTSGPIYFGAVVFFLFLMGLTLVKGPVKWWLSLGTLLMMLFSMGKNLEFFNEFFFNYVPLYNKFRTPNSILSIAAFLVPLLGLLALDRIVSGNAAREEVLRSLKIAGGIAGVICLFFILMGPSFFDFTHPNDAQESTAVLGQEALISDRKALMRRDSFRSLVLIALSGGLIWAYIHDKIKQAPLIAGIGILVFFDLWMVDRRYINSDNFIPERTMEANFAPRPADEQILQDTDPHFRVFDVTENPFQSTRASYYHKSLGGYHAAKLQRYQDIIDRYLIQGNQTVIDMLNTKYVIVRGNDGQAVAQQNPNPLGNAWFVSDIKMVATPNEEIDALAGIQADSTVVIHQEFSDYIGNLQPDKNGTIQLTAYRPNHLTYKSDADSEQLAVFSEIWYGPNKGWQAFIDGNPVPHIRANYLLRAMKIPAGDHTIEFVFDPKAYEVGKVLSFIFSTLIILGLIGLIGWYALRLKEEKTAPAVREKTAATKTKTTKKRRKR